MFQMQHYQAKSMNFPMEQNQVKTVNTRNVKIPSEGTNFPDVTTLANGKMTKM